MQHFFYLLCFFYFGSILASPSLHALETQNQGLHSRFNIEKDFRDFVEKPHPFGSIQNAKISQKIQKSLENFGWKTDLQKFSVLAPKKKSLNGEKPSLVRTNGQNVVAFWPGSAPCTVLLGGHYDTKFFSDMVFVGANDGGSSTALLLELSRQISKSHFPAGSLGSCTLYLVFFDGEESILPNWNDGQDTLQHEDHLYGSREFVQQNISDSNEIHHLPLNLVLIFDMVGHKKQNLWITQGSDDQYSHEFLSKKKNLTMQQNDLSVTDDQSPFLERHIPVLHMIDWTNLEEWHTSRDNLEIISYDKIEELAQSTLAFLEDNSFRH